MLPFYILAALGYGAASFAFGAGDGGARRNARLLLLLAAALHTATIGAQCVVGMHPFRSVHLAMSFGALLAVAGFLFVSARNRPMRALGAVVAPVALIAMTLGVALGPGDASSVDAPGLLIAHIAFASTGVAGFGLATGVAALYLAKERQLRNKQFSPGSRGLSLTGLDQLHTRLLAGVTPVFTVAIVTGVMVLGGMGAEAWAERSFELVASAVAWLASVVAIGSRAVWGVRGRRAATLTIVAFVSSLLIVITYGLRG
jgi:ABC-type uncharacterized transport system permease subunit